MKRMSRTSDNMAQKTDVQTLSGFFCAKNERYLKSWAKRRGHWARILQNQRGN